MASATADATERNGVRAEESSAHEADITAPPSPSLFPMLGRLWSHLAPQRRWQLGLLLAVMIASGLAEVVSLAAVVPLLSVLADPTRLWNQPWIRGRAMQFGMSQPQDLLLPVTLCFVAAAVLSAAVRLANVWLSGRVGAAIGSDLSQECYRRTLYQPYSVHTARNSSTVIAGLLTHVNRVTHQVIYSGLQLISCGILVLSVVACLLAIDRNIALVAIVVFGSAYIAISMLTKTRMLEASRRHVECSEALLKSVQEGLGGIRDVLLDQLQPFYLARYRENDVALRRVTAQADFLASFPRFLIEGLGMAAIASLAYCLVAQSGGIASALPLLGALALGAQRLLPALQQSYNSFAMARAGTADLQVVIALLDQPMPAQTPEQAHPLSLDDRVELRDVSFRYGACASPASWVLRHVNLSIQKGQRLAVTGMTGAGKSTLVDLLIGLLTPTEGELLVDGTRPCREAWQAAIAHVSQSIFLADTTIAENIALGAHADVIDQERLRTAAAQAHILDFIASLPEGFRTRVGERGVRLSGGQRQRIGIARALYKRAPVLVFDEATSALDTETERSLIETLSLLSRELTIVMIAHRPSTIAYCDRVIRVSNQSVYETSVLDSEPVDAVPAPA